MQLNDQQKGNESRNLLGREQQATTLVGIAAATDGTTKLHYPTRYK